MLSFLANTTEVIEGLREATKYDLASILIPAVFAFGVGIIISPIILKLLIKYKFWRKQQTLKAWDGKTAVITQKLNNDSRVKVPRMGGLVIILASALTTLFFGMLSFLDGEGSFINQLNFISRQETWLVIFSLIAGALIGVVDDLATVGCFNFLSKIFKQYVGGGLSLKTRLFIAVIIGCVCGYWFYYKLNETMIQIPFGDMWQIGIWIIPFIILTVVAMYSGGVIDGVDGLAGGVFANIFAIYGLIAMLQGNFELATFCFVLVGGLLAFLWHNIPPAKFYMSETGSMALTITLSIVAFLTNTIFLLPIIAFPLVLTSASVILQVAHKKLFKRKLFLVSPLHNYFRAKGYPAENVTMRYWVVAHITAIAGLVVYLLGYPNNFLQ